MHTIGGHAVVLGASRSALLPRSAQALEELFLGILAGLTAAGVRVLGHPGEARLSFGGHLLCLDGEPGDPPCQPSRAFLEAQVRRRVRALRSVTVRDKCAVTGLVTAPARDRVTGVRVLPAGNAGAEEIPAADLIANATGRGRRIAITGGLADAPQPVPACIRSGLRAPLYR
jgi:hypothetical protein